VRAPVTAIVVAYSGAPEDLRRSVESLLAQSRPPEEIVVVDNGPGGVLGRALLEWGLPVRVLRSGRNLGYVGGCNAGAVEATQPWLFFLNPDAVAAPECLERLLESAEDDTAIAGAQILLPDGETVNAGDNPVHITGLSWSGRYMEPREEGPPRAVASVSGAALMQRAEVFHALGGFCPAFFLYSDDTDMAWRARLAGWKVLFVPQATVRHDYEFEKGAYKWHYLERNRLWMVLSNYSARTLLLLAPLLLLTEIGIAYQAWQDGWLRQKLSGWRSTISSCREVASWRRRVQAMRRVDDADLMAQMRGAVRTPLLNSPMVHAVNPLMDLYRRLVIRALGG
jgi:GT2 family glycosyltransferase